jgi:hypothetical protein
MLTRDSPHLSCTAASNIGAGSQSECLSVGRDDAATAEKSMEGLLRNNCRKDSTLARHAFHFVDPVAIGNHSFANRETDSGTFMSISLMKLLENNKYFIVEKSRRSQFHYQLHENFRVGMEI